MTPEPTKPPINPNQDVHIRLAIMEQSFLSFSQEQQSMRARIDRLSEYIFGSDDEEGMKSQVKNLVKQVEQINKFLEDGTKEGRNVQREGFDRLRALEDRQKVMEEWKNQQIEMQKDKRGVARQYLFMVISAAAGSSISILIGLAITQLIGK